MKALTVRQPWASLIAKGVKTVETRSWSTKYRGPIAIHAGKRRPIRGRDGVGDWLIAPDYADGYATMWRSTTQPGDLFGSHETRVLPLGAVVATAQLVDVVPMVEGGAEGAVRTLDVDDNGSLWIVEPVRYPRRRAGMGGGVDAQERWETLCDRTSNFEVDQTDVSDQLPYGDYAPGRWAWLLADVKPARDRCPACWGQPDQPGGRCMTCDDGTPFAGKVHRPSEHCGTCLGRGVCDPVPAKGRQGLWEWTP